MNTTVTFFPDEKAQTMRVEEMTLHELRARILSTTKKRKAALPWLKLALFGEKRSEKNCLRHNENLLAITGIELDYDRAEIKFNDAVKTTRKARLRGMLYTSANYSDAKPRWRILLPTSIQLPPDQRAKLVARVNGLYGGTFSDESFTLSTAYYFGSVNNNPEHRAVVTEGVYIDQRDDLDADCDLQEGQERQR